MTFRVLSEMEQRIVLRALEVLPKMTALCLIEGLTNEDKAAVRVAAQVLVHVMNRSERLVPEEEFTAIGFLIRELE